MLLPPTSCRHVMLARRSECGPSPRKSHPSAAAANFRAFRTPESHTVVVCDLHPGERPRRLHLGVSGLQSNAKALCKPPQSERSPALGRLRFVNVAAPVSLLDANGSLNQINVLDH